MGAAGEVEGVEGVGSGVAVEVVVGAAVVEIVVDGVVVVVNGVVVGSGEGVVGVDGVVLGEVGTSVVLSVLDPSEGLEEVLVTSAGTSLFSGTSAAVVAVLSVVSTRAVSSITVRSVGGRERQGTRNKPSASSETKVTFTPIIAIKYYNLL